MKRIIKNKITKIQNVCQTDNFSIYFCNYQRLVFSEAFYSLVLILFLAFGFGGFNQMMLKATNAQKQAFEGDSSERERRAYPVLEQYENDW